MKRFIAVLSSLLVLPAFAEVAPIYYDEIVEYTDEMIDEAEQQQSDEAELAEKPQQTVAPRTVAGRSVSRAISTNTGNVASRTNTSTRAVATSPRTAQKTQRGTISRTTKTQSVVSRPQAATRSRTAVASRTANVSARTSNKSKPVTARIAANGNVISGVRTNSSAFNGSILTDSGEPLYISSGARAADRRPSSNNRKQGNMAARQTTKEDLDDMSSSLDTLAEATSYCKAQYAQCMDGYCNVLDDTQGRCSCSENIKIYEKAEKSLADISESFQDVVQKIKYIGLTTSQIESLFTETEAELSMKSKTDTSDLKRSLDAIKKKVVDVSSGSTTSTNLFDGLSFDMSGLLNTDFTSVFDLNAFLGTNKASNQRGASLFNTATQRCRTAVLNSCIEKGVDASTITNSYDLAIDKQCVEYERVLNEANEEMRANVRNAQNILQQARLLLAQKKNAYDLRGCVAALDECMQDEYVCGDDYELCLDPTGKYLAKGEIVKGGIPGVAGGSSRNQSLVTEKNLTAWISCGMYGLYSTWDYGTNGAKCECDEDDTSCSGMTNAWGKGSGENLNTYITEKMSLWEKNYDYKKVKSDTNDMATYLLRRVGYVDSKDDKSYGMCASVLKQCQDYTFDQKTKKYLVNNEVVRQYLALALTKIKLKQDTLIADYAETCWNDVYSCLSSNSYDESNTDTSASRTAINACRSEVATCMSVTGYYPADNNTLTLSQMTDWVKSKLLSCETGEYLYYDYTTSVISELQCRTCPTISVDGVNVQTTSAGGSATNCTCPDGYARAVVSEQSPATGTYWTIGNTNYTCEINADYCKYRQITRLPINEGGMSWSMLYTALLDVPSVKKFQVKGTSLGGDYAYYSAGGQEYRLKVKTAYNSTTKQCECPEISGVPAIATKTSLSPTSKTALQQINETYGENLDTLYGCNYNICGYARVGNIYLRSGSIYDNDHYTLLDISDTNNTQSIKQWQQNLIAISGHSVDASCVPDTDIAPLLDLSKTRATVLMKYNQGTEKCDCPDDFTDEDGNKYHFEQFSADINAMTCIANVTNNGRYGCRVYIDPAD